MTKYDPNCAWWDFSCTSNPQGCAWWEIGCEAAADVNALVQPTLTKVVIIVVVLVIGIVLLGFSPIGKRLPLPRFA